MIVTHAVMESYGKRNNTRRFCKLLSTSDLSFTESALKTLSIMFGECLKSINFAIELEIEGVIGKGVALL